VTVSWKLWAGVVVAALVSLAFPLAYVNVPFSTGQLRCGTPWDDASLDPQSTVDGTGITDATDKAVLLTVLTTCREEARQRVAAAVSIAMMIMVIDALCLVQAGRLLARAQPVAQHELLHFA
jgi:hypothetical protein